MAIVDDDLWIRRGRAGALSEVKGVEVVATLDHSSASGDPSLWDRVDVALIDAWDHRAGFDKFPGVGVVEAIRRVRTPAQTTILVVTGHVVNDMLRLRMAEAGADFFYAHDDVADLDRLAAAILEPSRERGALDGHGSGMVRPNAALAWVTDRGLQEAFSGESQKALPMSRRTIMRMRREVGSMAEAPASNSSGSLTPRTSPAWHQIKRFIDRARGASDPPTTTPNRTSPGD